MMSTNEKSRYIDITQVLCRQKSLCLCCVVCQPNITQSAIILVVVIVVVVVVVVAAVTEQLLLLVIVIVGVVVVLWFAEKM